MNYLEQAIYIAFIERINTEMNPMDQVLDDALKTAKTIAEIKTTMVPNTPTFQSGLAGLSASIGIQPPVPGGRRKVSSNEGLLNTEIEALRKQVEHSEAQCTKMDEKQAQAYGRVEEFREMFEKTITELSESAFTMQSEVFQILSSKE